MTADDLYLVSRKTYTGQYKSGFWITSGFFYLVSEQEGIDKYASNIELLEDLIFDEVGTEKQTMM